MRAARQEELEPMVALLRLLFAIEADFRFDAARQRRGLGLLLQDDRARVLVARVNGRVVGMCTGQVVISTAEGGPALLVEDVVVAPDHRGQGIGRALLKEAERRARSSGAARIELPSGSQRTEAHAFYRACGYSDGTVRFVKPLGSA